MGPEPITKIFCMSSLRGIFFFDFLNYVGAVALKGHGFSRAADGSDKVFGL
jgi:hypothetical protein